MKRITQRSMTVSHIMANPHPNFVSLVDQGANQRGFTELKRVSNPTGKDDTMAGLKGTVKKGKKQLDVAKVVFPKAAYADETAVKTYLAEAGFAVDTVEEDGDNWVAKSDDFDRFGDLTTISGDNSAVYYVGEMKPAEVTEAKTAVGDDAPAATDPVETPTYFAPGFTSNEEVTQKYMGWITEYSEGTTLSSVLQSGSDGLPPGIYDLNTAYYTALRNNLINGDWEGARAVTAEYGELVIALSKVLEDATVAGDTIQKSTLVAKAARDPNAEASTEEQPAPAADVEAKADTIPTAEDAEPTTTTEPAPVEDNAPVSKKDITDMASLIASSVAKAMTDALVPVISGVQTSVTEASTKTEAAVTELREEVSKTASRVEGLESRTQTRKGVDDETGNDTPEPAVQKAKTTTVDVLKGNALGMRRRPY